MADAVAHRNLQMICKAISKAHEAQNLTIFGCNAPYHLADYFHLTGWKKHRTRDIVTKELFGILAHARRTIGNRFEIFTCNETQTRHLPDEFRFPPRHDFRDDEMP